MTSHPLNTLETLSLAEAADKLDFLVSRAVRDRKPTVIIGSEEERAVLISYEDYEELLRFREER